MKIISSGNKQKNKDTRRFTCANCGCVFDCEKDEFWEKETTNSNITISWSASTTYMTCCPECHKVVEDTAYNSYYYTCTSDSVNIATVKSDIANVTLTGDSFSDCKKK